MEMSSTEQSTTSLLKSRNYALFWVGSLLSNMGTWMQMVAEPWLMLSLGGSSLMVGLDAFAISGPGWLLTLWGGLLADRFNRKNIVLYFQIIQMLTVAIIIALMYYQLLTPWMLILASLVAGITDSLSMPALQTLVPSLVKKEEMTRAISLNALQFNISRMVGPAIAGFAMAKYGAISCFSGNLISYIPLFFAVILIYPKKSHIRPLVRIEKDWKPRWHDFSLILANKQHLKFLLSIFINGLLVIPLIIFVPVLLKLALHGAVEHLGLVMGASGVGGLIGALAGLAVPEEFKRGKNPILLAAVSGVLVALLANNTNIILLGIGLMVVGIMTGVLAVLVNSRLQMDSVDHHLGRAASFFQLALQGGMALGGLWTGVLSETLGIQSALLINGVLAVILQLGLFISK